MYNWFEHELDSEDIYNNVYGIDDEIWSDNILRLSPRTLLWTYLHFQDLTEDKIIITINDFETARCMYINCGYPLVLNTFNEDELIKWMDKCSPWINRNPENRYYSWEIDMNLISDVNTLSDKEIVLVDFNERAARDYLALINLEIDWWKMSSEEKVSKITPRYLYSQNTTPLPYEEMKKKVKAWKHIPEKYKDK